MFVIIAKNNKYVNSIEREREREREKERDRDRQRETGIFRCHFPGKSQ